MAEQIQVNYEALSQVENRFVQLSSDVEDMAAKLKKQEATLQRGGWIGRGSEAFYAEMDDLVLPAIGRLGEALKEAGQVLNRVARIFSEAEESSQSGFSL